MSSPENELPFREATRSTAIRDLGLKIEGTRLEPICRDFLAELERVGIRRLRPRLYLSTEWGVPFDTVSIAIPFYLTRDDLTALHGDRTGHVEGFSRADILRYLRHEMGHVVNYAYRLYDDPEWVKHFGSITQPYVDEYVPRPFSRAYVRHLPGWYAQKHPDEDWAETFAVWLTPGRDWRAEYADWPGALAKLEYCDAVMKATAERDPIITDDDLDEDVADLAFSVDDFYQQVDGDKNEMPHGLDGALRAIFDDLDEPADTPRKSARGLLFRLERELCANVYRWTGHFPERTRQLCRHLAERAEALGLHYAEPRELDAAVAVTTLVTALAMNHVLTGSYLP